MNKQKKIAVVISAAERVTKKLAGETPCSVTRLGLMNKKHLDLQPVIGNNGPTRADVDRFIVALAETLANEDTGIKGRFTSEVTSEANDGVYFARFTLK